MTIIQKIIVRKNIEKRGLNPTTIKIKKGPK